MVVSPDDSLCGGLLSPCPIRAVVPTVSTHLLDLPGKQPPGSGVMAVLTITAWQCCYQCCPICAVAPAVCTPLLDLPGKQPPGSRALVSTSSCPSAGPCKCTCLLAIPPLFPLARVWLSCHLARSNFAAWQHAFELIPWAVAQTRAGSQTLHRLIPPPSPLRAQATHACCRH